MIYCKEIVIPANTGRYAPLSSQVDIVEGVVKRVWVRWRWGSACLAGCQVFRASFQLWPTSLGQWFQSSIHETTFEENYPISDEPMHFIIKSYNLDDTFPHTVWVSFSVLRPEYGAKLMGLMDFLAKEGFP